MFCESCGERLHQGIRTCPSCNASVNWEQDGGKLTGGAEKIIGVGEIVTGATADLGFMKERVVEAFSPGHLTELGISLLRGEKIIKELSIGFLERGLFFWRRGRLILTNRRVVGYSRKLITEQIVASHLRDVTGVISGTQFSRISAAIGASLIVAGMYYLFSSLIGQSGADGILQAFLFIALGGIIVLFSRQKGIWLASYDRRFGIELTRLGVGESDEFITALFDAREVFFKESAF